MKLSVNHITYVSGHVGTLDVPPTSTPEQIADAIDDFVQEHIDNSLCHACSARVGDAGDYSINAETEEHGTVYDDSLLSSVLAWQTEVLNALGLPGSAARDVPAILRALRETELRPHLLWDPAGQRLLLSETRVTAWKNFKAGDPFKRAGQPDPAPVVTHDLKRGDPVTVYEDTRSMNRYAAPTAHLEELGILPVNPVRSGE